MNPKTKIIIEAILVFFCLILGSLILCVLLGTRGVTVAVLSLGVFWGFILFHIPMYYYRKYKGKEVVDNMTYGNKEKYVCTTCGREGYFYGEPKSTDCQKIGCPGIMFKKER